MKRILKIAAAVRAAAEELTPKAHRSSLGGACGPASLVLAELIGPEAKLERGTYLETCGVSTYHCWVRLRAGHIVDITATQFGRRPKVHVLKKGPRYQVEESGPAAVEDVEWQSDNHDFSIRLKPLRIRAMSKLTFNMNGSY